MGESSGISCMDSVILATGGYDHTIKLWQAASGICTRTMQHADSQVNALRITPDRHLLASAGYQHIRMYDFVSNNPNPVINYEGVSKNVVEVGFHEEGKWMFTGGEDCNARIWDLRSRSSSLHCERIFQVSAPVTCVCLHPNQGELIVGDQSGVVHIWDLRTDHNEQLIPAGNNDSSIQSLDVDCHSQRLVAVNSLGTCYVWQLSDPSRADSNSPEVISEGPPPSPSPRCSKATPTHKMAAHQSYALRCVFSPDCRLLATTSADQTARIWNTEDFSLVRELGTSNQRWVWDAAFTLDSKFLLTASSDGIGRLWNIETGEVDKEYAGHQKAITSLAFCDVGVPVSPSTSSAAE